MDVSTYFFEVDPPGAVIESSVLYPLKECQSNKVVGVCAIGESTLKCWISKDASFKLDLDDSHEVYFTPKNQFNKFADLNCSIVKGVIEYFSHGLISPFKIDETSIKVRVYCNANTERENRA